MYGLSASCEAHRWLQPSDWYTVTREQVRVKGGGGLIARYPSMEAALKAIYPEVAWDSSKFISTVRNPSGYWADIEHQREFLEKTAQRLGLKQVWLMICTYLPFLTSTERDIIAV